ncbi:MAG: LacI family DNA-binding transcriptional regulator [Clostridiales bacterium]|nr:LacI family DNA-binding transcriptional regulator [Clostridiales bacterium]
MADNRLTIDDIAKALNISKTTVSRAISGKGRIGPATREKVLAYIKEHDYRPSPLAKGLAQSKTYNIAWVIPGDSTVTELPFFQKCMIGVSDIASTFDHDILLCMVYEDNFSSLERIVKNRKVDGVILARTLFHDPCIEFLLESKIPFVTIGSTPYKNVFQIDNDHIGACKELTEVLLLKGMKKVALIGGDENHIVNRSRRDGYLKAFSDLKIPVDKDIVYMNADSKPVVVRSVNDAVNKQVDCIVCTDDMITVYALDEIRKIGLKVPDDIKVASFYNSAVLETYQPAITTLDYDPKQLGAEACTSLFSLMNGEDIPKKKLLHYDVTLKRSTQ